MIFETDHHLKDRKITLIVFRGSSYPRTFDVPLSWINHLGWIVGFFLFALTLSTGLGVKFYLNLKQVDTSRVESLQRELDELRLKGAAGLSKVGQPPVAVISAGPNVVTGTATTTIGGANVVSTSASVAAVPSVSEVVVAPVVETKPGLFERAKTFFTRFIPQSTVSEKQAGSVPALQATGSVQENIAASPVVIQSTGSQMEVSTSGAKVDAVNPSPVAMSQAPIQETGAAAGLPSKPSVPTATTALSNFAQYFFPKEFFAPVAGRDQVPIQLTPIKISYQGKILNVKTAIQYNRNDGQSQSGHFIVVGRTPDAVFVYPSGVIQDVTQNALLNPARGEYFSVGRYREIDADLGPLEARGTVQYVEVFLFNNANQPIYYERARPQ